MLNQIFKIQYGPYLQNVGVDEATVVWVTNYDDLSWVEVAPNVNIHFYDEERPLFYETINGRKAVGTVHKVKIKGFKEGVSYRYRIAILSMAVYQLSTIIASSKPNGLKRLFKAKILSARR